MKRLLLSLGFLFCGFESQLIAQQILNGLGPSPTASLNQTGNQFGVSFINQSVGTESTLIVNPVSPLVINGQKYPNGITTDANALGNIIFQQGKLNANVYGKVGDSTLSMNMITVSQDNDITFQNRVFCQGMNIADQASVTMNGNLDVGNNAVTFSGKTSKLFMGTNTGIIGQVGNSIENGQVSFASFDATEPLNAIIGDVFVNKLIFGDAQRPYVIEGNVSTKNITINGDQNRVRITSNLTLNSASLDMHGENGIDVDGSNTVTGPLTINFKKTKKGTYTLINAVSGTTGGTINVNSDSVFTKGTAELTNGTLVLEVEKAKKGPIIAGGGGGGGLGVIGNIIGIGLLLPVVPAPDGMTEVMESLQPLSEAFPDSDLAFVESQIDSPTAQGYIENVYQIYPGFALIGVSREAFNTAKQFQKVWLEHLNRNRVLCQFGKADDSCTPCHTNNREARVWVDGFGYYGRQSNRTPGFGYKGNTWGGLIGTEKSISDAFSLGVGLGYARTGLKKSQFSVKAPHTNTTHFDTYMWTLTGSYLCDPWFMDGGVSVGWNRYVGKRYININLLNRKAKASYHGIQCSGFLVSGYQYDYRQFEITPFASMFYSYLHMNSYAESGANTLNLRVKSQNYRYLQSGLGLKVAYPLTTCYGDYLPEIHTIWLHDFSTLGTDVSASFSGLGASAGYWRSKGPRFDQNYWNIGASVTCYANSNLSLLLDYDFERGNHYYTHQGFVELSYAF